MGCIGEMMESHRVTLCNVRTCIRTLPSVTSDILYMLLCVCVGVCVCVCGEQVDDQLYIAISPFRSHK